MNNWKRKVNVLKYDSDVIKHSIKSNRSTKDKTNNKYIIQNYHFELSCLQLLRSTALGMLTRAYKYKNYNYKYNYNYKVACFIMSYAAIIDLLLGEKDGYLSFDYDNKNMLRDFSTAARTGEIAQGINYAYAQEELNANVIYDFKDYAYKVRNISQKCKDRTPDYVYCDENNKIGILESKGTKDADPTKYLISGYNQCEAGEKYLSIHGIIPANSYVSAVSFGTTSRHMKRYTSIYTFDPLNEVCSRDTNKEKNQLYEYSKLFYLAQNKTAAEKLMRGEKLSGDDLENVKEDSENNGIIIGQWDLKSVHNNKKISIKLGIKSSLAEYLTENTDSIS